MGDNRTIVDDVRPRCSDYNAPRSGSLGRLCKTYASLSKGPRGSQSGHPVMNWQAERDIPHASRPETGGRCRLQCQPWHRNTIVHHFALKRKHHSSGRRDPHRSTSYPGRTSRSIATALTDVDLYAQFRNTGKPLTTEPKRATS